MDFDHSFSKNNFEGPKLTPSHGSISFLFHFLKTVPNTSHPASAKALFQSCILFSKCSSHASRRAPLLYAERIIFPTRSSPLLSIPSRIVVLKLCFPR